MITAWGEAVWWLKGRPDQKVDIWGTFPEDCDFVASILDSEAVCQMTRGQYQEYCQDQGHDDVAANNRAYWQEIASAIQAGKPVLQQVRDEYEYIQVHGAE